MTLEDAARECCPTCGGSTLILTASQIDRRQVDEKFCPACLDASGKPTGRRYPLLGRACHGSLVVRGENSQGIICYTERIATPTICQELWPKNRPPDCRTINRLSWRTDEWVNKCICGGIGLIPDLSREALDATAERLGFGVIAIMPIPEGFRYVYGRTNVVKGHPPSESSEGPDREAAAQAALLALLAAER